MMAGAARAERPQGVASVVYRAIRAVLVHPISIALKRLVRDLTWRVKGCSVVNPPTPPEVKSVLFVCLGNICRSPFAAGLARLLAENAGRSATTFASAGIRTVQAEQSPADACRASAMYRVDLCAHRTQPLTPEMMRFHDAVLVMEASQFWRLQSEYPDLTHRIFLLALFDEQPGGPYERYNIEDPFGRSSEAFEACYSRIARAVRNWSRTLPASGSRVDE